MRIPLPSPLETRDGTCGKDAKMLNAFVDEGMVYKRPAADTAFATTTGQAQGGIYDINSLVYIINADVVHSYNAAGTLQQTIAL